jgi:hypothetical protein
LLSWDRLNAANGSLLILQVAELDADNSDQFCAQHACSVEAQPGLGSDPFGGHENRLGLAL